MNKLTKDDMLGLLEHWSMAELCIYGRVNALCMNIPRAYNIRDNWKYFWGEINKSGIITIGSKCNCHEEETLVRMLLLHDFVNWLYE